MLIRVSSGHLISISTVVASVLGWYPRGFHPNRRVNHREIEVYMVQERSSDYLFRLYFDHAFSMCSSGALPKLIRVTKQLPDRHSELVLELAYRRVHMKGTFYLWRMHDIGGNSNKREIIRNLCGWIVFLRGEDKEFPLGYMSLHGSLGFGLFQEVTISLCTQDVPHYL
ncbi:hypothetical protein TorRG33x02_064770 [Trema orientale]|uniref:Uncharacterized protein n=1 Tax=Trema orientale TaxID=63057 RepID=A0A2P5FJD1_TREOI|nr:hypothetical protein TorRG33x02_064770 [Trema orientale]